MMAGRNTQAVNRKRWFGRIRLIAEARRLKSPSPRRLLGLRIFTVTKMYRSERNGRRSRDLPSTYALRGPNATPDTHGASGHKHG